MSSIHLLSCLLPQRWKIGRKSTTPAVEIGKGRWESTQHSPIVEDFSDKTLPRRAHRLRRTRRILDFHSLSGNHIADDDIFPPISARSSLSSANGLWPEKCIHILPSESDDFCFICPQSRACSAPVAGTKQEGDAADNVSLSPSTPPVLCPRNRPLPCKHGKGKEEEESDEPTSLWDEAESPAISTCPHVLPRGGEDFFFICQQPRACLSVANENYEDGSFIPRSKLSILQDDNSSPSPSPTPVLRPRNRPMPCKVGNGKGEEESDESTILWDELDSPPVSPPPALSPHNRPSPCELEKRNDGEESDESVVRPWVEDRGIRPWLCNLRKRKEDEESDESTILWDEVPPSLRPRHRATTIPILTTGKREGKSNRQEEETKNEIKEETKNKMKEERKEETIEETIEETEEETKEDIFGWVVNSLSDTVDEEIWLSSGMNYPFDF